MLKKIAVCLAALGALALGACDLPTLNLQSQVNLNTTKGIIAGYGIALNVEKAIKKVPLCLTGTAPSITNICVRRSAIVKLQKADKQVNADINALVSFENNFPTIAPSDYIAAAQQSLLALQTVINGAKD